MKHPLHFTLLFLSLFIAFPDFAQQKAKPQQNLDQEVALVDKELVFSIYPNPNKGLFKVVWEEENTITELKIVNALGKQVFFSPVMDLKELAVDLTHLPEGLYFLKVVTEEGETLSKIYVEN